MDYSKTLHLPETEFPMRGNLPKKEPGFVEFWQQNHLYEKRIEEDMSMQLKYVTQQLNSLSQRQTQIIDGFIAGKERIIEQTGQITSGMLEAIQKRSLALGTSVSNNSSNDIKLLNNTEKLALAEKTE